MDRIANIVVLMPVYRDWVSASAVSRALDDTLAGWPALRVRVLLVDDGSPEGAAGWRPFAPQALLDISILRLRANLGHQRAICAGLCHVHESLPCDFVVVMDADGEDRPEDALRLVGLAVDSSQPIWFAERRKRMSGMAFRAGYSAFRFVHRILTGVSVRVGNFSVLRFSVLSRLVAMPELWNHYAGAVFKSGLRFGTVPMDRGNRIAGNSQMNLVSLVSHGLSGIATFQETVTTRILIFNALGLVLLLSTAATVIGIRTFTNLAIPGWATYVIGFIVLSSMQLLALSFSLVFSAVASRNKMLFLPFRDYIGFVDCVVSLTAPDADRDTAGRSD